MARDANADRKLVSSGRQRCTDGAPGSTTSRPAKKRSTSLRVRTVAAIWVAPVLEARGPVCGRAGMGLARGEDVVDWISAQMAGRGAGGLPLPGCVAVVRSRAGRGRGGRPPDLRLVEQLGTIGYVEQSSECFWWADSGVGGPDPCSGGLPPVTTGDGLVVDRVSGAGCPRKADQWWSQVVAAFCRLRRPSPGRSVQSGRRWSKDRSQGAGMALTARRSAVGCAAPMGGLR